LHELAHVTDELTGGKAREQLRGRFEPGFWDQKRREFEQLKSDPQGALANNADFTEEMYARLIAQDFAGAAGPLARELNDYLKNNGVNLADPEILKQFLPDKESIRQGFWSNFVTKKAAAEGDSGSDEKLEPPITDPERLQKLWGKFDNKVKDIRAKLEAISKSDADGKAEFISGAEGYIQEIRSTLDANPTESGFTAAFENDSKAEPPGLKGVEEVCNSSLDDVVKSETDSSGYFKEIWDNTTFLTLHDIFTTGKTVLVDHFKRQIERSSKRRTGVAGSSIFTGRLAAEYDLQAESAESEEVSKVQESLKNKDPWQVYDRLDSTSNADVVKACLNQLAETGMLDWRNKVVWKAFNRLNCGVRFREEDTVDYGLIRKKMLKACTIIWDCDYFSSTDRKNNSSYDSHKKEYENEANLTANIAGELKSMLYDKKTKGERARVDPMRYEMFIDFCIPAGKMTPEHVIYYIIQGVAKGIMTPERAISLDNSYLNNVPVINYFSSYNPSLAEYKKWGKMFDTEDCAMHPGFTRWLNANFMTSQRVVERTIKASAQPDKWDHDYANYIASIGDMTSAKSYLGLNHDGSPKYPSTSYWNAVDGQIQHLTDIANFSYELSDKDKISWLSRQAGYLATFDGIAYNRLDKENNRLFRLTASDKNTMSRSKGYSKLKTREASQRIRDILTAIEPDYFKTLFEIKEPKGGDARKVKKLIGEFEQGGKYHSYLYDKDGNKDIDEPKDLKGLYDIIPAFVERHCERNLGDPKADPLRRTFEKAREIYRKDHGDQPPKKDDNWNWKTNEVSPYYADAV
jgi:hypothetical protein